MTVVESPKPSGKNNIIHLKPGLNYTELAKDGENIVTAKVVFIIMSAS